MWALYNTILHRYPIPTEMASSAVLWCSGDLLAQYLEQNQNNNNHNNSNNNNNGTAGKEQEPTASAAPSSSVDDDDSKRQGQQEQQQQNCQEKESNPPMLLSQDKSNKSNTKNSNTIDNVHHRPTTLDWHRVGIQTVYAGLIWAPFGHYWYGWLDRTAHTLALSPKGTNTGRRIRFVGTKLVLEILLLHPIALIAFFTCVGLMGGDKPKEIIQHLRTNFVPSVLLEFCMWTPIDISTFLFVPVKHQLLVVNTVCLFESIMLSYIKANGITFPWHGGKQKKKHSNDADNDQAQPKASQEKKKTE